MRLQSPEFRRFLFCRDLSLVGIGMIFGALAMWFVIDIVAPLIDHITLGGF